jgi:phage/plasmid-like protein (TIGR03299 family)
MSKETLEWLNTQILVDGSLGRPWWENQVMQAEGESTIYDGPVPVADIERRLFNFTLESAPVYIAIPATMDDATGIGPDGSPVKFVECNDRQGIYRSDNHETLGLFKSGYVPHQYTSDLMATTRTLTMDNLLTVQSAGLLQGGAQAWIQVAQRARSIITPEGVEFRPYVLGATSANGSLSSFWTEVFGLTVCDNTMTDNRSHGRGEIRARHTSNSLAKIRDAATAFARLDGMAEEFSALVAEECATVVSPAAWAKVLDALVPVPEEKGKGRTMASTKRDELVSLYTSDPRCAPWSGTAFGVKQTFNTYNQHVGIVRGAHRAERNIANTLTGKIAAEDAAVMAALGKVLASA